VSSRSFSVFLSTALQISFHPPFGLPVGLDSRGPFQNRPLGNEMRITDTGWRTSSPCRVLPGISFPRRWLFTEFCTRAPPFHLLNASASSTRVVVVPPYTFFLCFYVLNRSPWSSRRSLFLFVRLGRTVAALVFFPYFWRCLHVLLRPTCLPAAMTRGRRFDVPRSGSNPFTARWASPSPPSSLDFLLMSFFFTSTFFFFFFFFFFFCFFFLFFRIAKTAFRRLWRR